MCDDNQSEHELPRLLNFRRNVYKCRDKFENISILLSVELRARKWGMREAGNYHHIVGYRAIY